MVLKSIIDFLESTNVEKESSEYAPINAIRYPRYLRDKTGLPDPYAHAVFPHDIFPEEQYRKFYLPTIPALFDIIILINDILSFYKESIRGTERVNYICTLAKTTGKTAVQCLYDANDGLVKSIAEMRGILKPQPTLLAHANDFLAAYIHWHIRTISRYHLDEVMGILKMDVADPVKPDVSTSVQPNDAMVAV